MLAPDEKTSTKTVTVTTPPLPCTAFVAKTPPLPCDSTAFAFVAATSKTLPFLAGPQVLFSILGFVFNLTLLGANKRNKAPLDALPPSPSSCCLCPLDS